MKPLELRELSDKALVEHARVARRDLFGLRLQNATGELDSTTRIRAVRRDLARTLTIARERGLEINSDMERSSG